MSGGQKQWIAEINFCSKQQHIYDEDEINNLKYT